LIVVRNDGVTSTVHVAASSQLTISSANDHEGRPL